MENEDFDGVDLDLDDRVRCADCAKKKSERVVERYPADVFDSIRRKNYKCFQWMFEAPIIKNGWASVSYSQDVCLVTRLLCFPQDVKHRCDWFSTEVVDVVDNWLNEDDRTQQPSDPGHVGPSVQTGPAPGVDTEWWA